MARGDTITTNYPSSGGTDVPQVGDSETAATASVVDILEALIAIAETKVTSAELNINAPLDAQTQGIDNITYLQLVTQSSSPGNEYIWTKSVSSVDELFYTDSAGNEIQLTSGGQVNASATGGITGTGYGTGGVAVNWNGAGTNYQFKSGSGADDYAALTCDGVQFRDGSSHYVLVDAPSLSSNYTLTLPNSVGSAGLVTSDGSGGLAFESTIPDDLTFSGVLTFTGANVVSETFTFTDFADFKHGSVTKNLDLASAIGTGWSTGLNGNGHWFSNTAGSHTLYIPIPALDTDMRIKSAYVKVDNDWAATNHTCSLVHITPDTTETQVDAGATQAGDTWNAIPSSGDSDHTVLSRRVYYLKVSFDSTADTGSLTVEGAEVTYDRV